MTQNKIYEHGRIVEKCRLTHNQRYKWGYGTSVNIRVDKADLLPFRFGACLKCLMKWTVAARKKFQGKKIISSKIEYKFAYRKCNLNVDTEIQTCTQLPEEDLAIVALCLTSGGAPGPYEWGLFQSLSVICQLQSFRILVGIQLRCVLPIAI